MAPDERRASEDASNSGVHLVERPATHPDHTPANLSAIDRAGRHAAPRQHHTPPAWLDAISLAEGGLLADVSVVLQLAAIYLPLIGTVLAPAVPTPFAVLMLRRGARVTLLAAAVATFLVTILTGPHFGWRIGLQAVVGLIFGWAMRRRIRPLVVWSMGTVVVSVTTFIAAMGVIFITGLPIHDLVAEMRNTMAVAATWMAYAALALHQQAHWLAIRPALVLLALTGLRFWPVLTFLYILTFTLPTVALYYAVANGAVRVLGHDVPLFPPRWALRLVRAGVLMLAAPARLGRRRGLPAKLAMAREKDEP